MITQKVRRIPNPVPKIINPLGKGWPQPDADNLQFFEVAAGGDKFVKISDLDKKKLHRYDRGFPSGVYDGKMWLSGNFIVWFAPSPTKENHCTNVSAQIIGTL